MIIIIKTLVCITTVIKLKFPNWVDSKCWEHDVAEVSVPLGSEKRAFLETSVAAGPVNYQWEDGFGGKNFQHIKILGSRITKSYKLEEYYLRAMGQHLFSHMLSKEETLCLVSVFCSHMCHRERKFQCNINEQRSLIFPNTFWQHSTYIIIWNHKELWNVSNTQQNLIC